MVRIINGNSRRSIWVITKNELKARTIIDTDRELNMGLSVAGLKGEVSSKLDFLSEELSFVCFL